MILGVFQTAPIVREYEEAKAFYCGKLGFLILEDTLLPGGKRWVRLGAPGEKGAEIILSRAVDENLRLIVGNQAGGCVLFFLRTNDFENDYRQLSERGVEFVESSREESYGKVAVFKDLYGNRIDLIGIVAGS
jgi:catechol 2,3-dioxygenase-like lactoylglutathione lyase family enzyme